MKSLAVSLMVVCAPALAQSVLQSTLSNAHNAANAVAVQEATSTFVSKPELTNCVPLMAPNPPSTEYVEPQDGYSTAWSGSNYERPAPFEAPASGITANTSSMQSEAWAGASAISSTIAGAKKTEQISQSAYTSQWSEDGKTKGVAEVTSNGKTYRVYNGELPNVPTAVPPPFYENGIVFCR
jgi:hypothetical protein